MPPDESNPLQRKFRAIFDSYERGFPFYSRFIDVGVFGPDISLRFDRRFETYHHLYLNIKNLLEKDILRYDAAHFILTNFTEMLILPYSVELRGSGRDGGPIYTEDELNSRVRATFDFMVEEITQIEGERPLSAHKIIEMLSTSSVWAKLSDQFDGWGG